MKIAQISPLMESVPPRLYGGSERIVSYLTDELVRQGHDVTLFASGDSVSSAKLVRCVPMALRLDANVRDPIPYYMLMLDRVREMARRIRYPAFPHRPVSLSAVSADRQSDRDHSARTAGPARPEAACMSASATCRWCRSPTRSESRFANANFAATVYHGLPLQTAQAQSTSRAAIMWRSSDVSPRKSGRTGRSGSPRRSACESRSRPRSTRSTRPISARPSRRSSISPASNISARSTSARRANSWAKRAHCCSRSTGRSRSDCR